MEKQISSKLVYDGGVVKVYYDRVLTEYGNEAGRDVVRHNGGAGVIAMDEKGDVLLVRQFRYAVGEELIEIPAGKLEPGEDPIMTAARELTEEAGVIAEKLELLGSIIPTCGYCDEIIYVYEAEGLSASIQNLDEDEHLTVFSMPLEKAVQAVMSGEIKDAKTVYAILALNEKLRNNQK